ncbi:STN and carboxypeptidase regulatory-like domain-containing protein [Mucilaginibacter sp. JRF]|uniref:STN and carboxypeptidase regulatory-like domain-containing protein n=1 Tax=Mucilaginibacter sp. JRF TaxID=2780088 RepID=UPI001D15E85A|nr:STN and carboxypeptidase regulatory-like domain-containing protein [Mucilaginibacter sp. JRF]
MRCSILVLVIHLTFAGMLLANRVDGQALQEKVTLSLNKATVAQSLSAIETNSSVKFSVREKLVSSIIKSVTLSARNEPVKNVLDDILAHTGLQYKLVEGYVIIEAIPAPVRIYGKVIDAKTQESLPGVSIKIKNWQGGTLTDINGAFVVTIPTENATLVFSYTGYETAEVAVNKTTQQITVSLK